MIEQEIFGDSNLVHKEDNKITYCDFLDDDRYVAQFLKVDDVNWQGSQQMIEEPIIENMPQPIQETHQLVMQEPIQNAKCHKKRSTFHNFQKHLVTTIRSIINSSKFGKDPETSLCQKKIWKIFMNSNKINKTLVTMIVGDLNLQNSCKINQYGFKDIVKEFNPSQIKQAQKNISQQLLSQLTIANLQEQLTSRRMKHKKQFIVYFQAFLQELVNGQLDKRMAKCTKLLKHENL